MNIGGAAWNNLLELGDCLSDRGCTLVRDADSSLGIAIMIVLALSVGGLILLYNGLSGVLQLLPDGLTARLKVSLRVVSPIPAMLWFYLWLAYSLTECQGQGVLLWMITSPLFTFVLMMGFLGIVAGLSFVIGVATSSNPIAYISNQRWVWSVLVAVVTGILIGWHVLYDAVPQIAAGPYDRGPQWLQAALDVWTLHIPITVLWQLTKVLATIPGILAFAVLGALSVILPQHTAAARAAGLASALTTAAVGQVIGLVISTCVVIVVSLLLIALLALAALFFAAYVMAYALVIAFIGAMVMKAVKS
ncbi:MAG TPA: hypothetical protein VF444_03015 [Pseudonocardiaceae bacterium]